MASTWSDNLKIELLGTGDTNWGTLTNNNFKWALEESITGYGTATFPSDADYDWGAGFTNSNSSQAQRNLVVRVTGTISTTRNLIVPLNSAGTAPIEKQYIFWNDTTGGQAIVVKTPSGTGVTILNGVRMHVFVDGTNVVQMSNYDVSRTVGTLSLTNALSVANGGTGATTFSSGQFLKGAGTGAVITAATVALASEVSGTLPVANGGTGVTTSTGTGSVVRSTSPTLTTPTLGAASATSVALAAGALGTPSLTATGDLNTGMWFPAADTLAWSTNGVEAMRIDSSGNVGVGTNSPSAKLHVSGSTDRVAFFNSTNDTEIAFATNNAVKATIYTDFTSGGIYPNSAGIVLRNYTYGNGGVKFILSNGVGTPTERFNVTEDGVMYCGGVYNTTVGATNRDVYVDNGGVVGYLTSIRASKINIADLSDVNWLYQLNPVTFNYRKKDKGTYTDEADGPVQFGLIAEDVETVKPELCFYDVLESGGTELKGVSYSSLITPLLKAVQQLKDELEVAKARIAALEQK